MLRAVVVGDVCVCVCVTKKPTREYCVHTQRQDRSPPAQIYLFLAREAGFNTSDLLLISLEQIYTCLRKHANCFQ